MYIKEVFEWDGSWRDLYIFNTTIDDWQILIKFLLQSQYPSSYMVNGESTEFPEHVIQIFEIYDDVDRLFSVMVNDI